MAFFLFLQNNISPKSSKMSHFQLITAKIILAKLKLTWLLGRRIKTKRLEIYQIPAKIKLNFKENEIEIMIFETGKDENVYTSIITEEQTTNTGNNSQAQNVRIAEISYLPITTPFQIAGTVSR